MAVDKREVARADEGKYTPDLSELDQRFGEILAGKADASSASGNATRWVNLGRACEILGVNESTVRRWADSGEIRCFRTPGGHRRFAEGDLYAMTEGGAQRSESDLETAAVTRIRRQLHSGNKGGAAASWYATIEEDERDALRPLGRRLVELVGEYIARKGRRGQVEQEVDDIGRRYGQILHERGMPLMRAVQAFTFFRRSLDETAKQLAERNSMTAEEAARAREDIAGLADRVLLGVTSAYDPSIRAAG